MNLSDPKDVDYLYTKHFGELQTRTPLERLIDYVERDADTIRQSDTTPESLQTALVIHSNALNMIVSYLREMEDGRRQGSD